MSGQTTGDLPVASSRPTVKDVADSRGFGSRHDLHQFHEVGRLCIVGNAEGRGIFQHRLEFGRADGGGGRRNHRSGRATELGAAQQFLLVGKILGNCLDHEIPLRNGTVQIGIRLDPGEDRRFLRSVGEAVFRKNIVGGLDSGLRFGKACRPAGPQPDMRASQGQGKGDLRPHGAGTQHGRGRAVWRISRLRSSHGLPS